MSAYDNLHIRGHEEIYLERSQKRFDQINNLSAQVGPIYVVHPDDLKLTELVNEQITSKPVYSFDSLDKCNHEPYRKRSIQLFYGSYISQKSSTYT